MREARTGMNAPRIMSSQREAVIACQPASACDHVAAGRAGTTVPNHHQMT
jgi:hypothetical protein